MSEILKVERQQDAVVLLTLNRPERMNALDPPLLSRLDEALSELEADDSVSCLILTGSGRGFCSGADLQMLADRTVSTGIEGVRFMWSLQETLLRLYRYPKPVIAAVNGAAVGAGFSLALACDFILAARSARFSMIFGQLGLVPDLGSFFLLPRAVGLPKARELAFTADFVSAEEAVRIGIASAVVPDEELLSNAHARASRVAAMSPMALRLTKETLNQSLEMSMETLLSKEALMQGLLIASDDFREGVRAFQEKRRPHFQGH